MKAFIVDRYKKKGALRFGDMPEPALRDDDVLVEIYAAGLNLLDSRIRDGKFKPGDEVYARPADGRIGAFAEFIAIKEADVAIKPKALTMEEAASIPLVGLTA